MQPQIAPPLIPTNLQGLNAMGAYNSAMVQPQLNITPALPTIMLPEAIHLLKGERILNSDGKLHSIIEKTPEFTNVTKMSPVNERCISEIISRDNKTDLIIREQFNMLKSDGTIDGISINEYYPNSDKLKRYTVYDGGKPDYVEEYEYPTKDITIGKIHDYKEKKFIINEYNKATGFMKTTVFDENKVLTSTMTANLDGSGETVYYKNGVPSKVETRLKDTPIVNNTGKNPFADKDLIPHAKVSLNYNPLDLQGEKTFYSNGLVETLKVNGSDKNCEYYYNPDGRLASMTEKYPNGSSMFVEFSNFGQNILETYNNEQSKSTSWEQDGTYYVHYKEKDFSKNFSTSFNNNEYFYREESNGNNSFMVFNKNLELIRTGDFTDKKLSVSNQ